MKYDWDKMTPREIDILVAEKVMGWTDIGEPIPSVKETLEIDLIGSRPDTEGNFFRIPRYTMLIFSAWEIVEELMDTHSAAIQGPRETENWYCSFATRPNLTEGGYTNYQGTASTAPEAICLAALRASGVEI